MIVDKTSHESQLSSTVILVWPGFDALLTLLPGHLIDESNMSEKWFCVSSYVYLEKPYPGRSCGTSRCWKRKGNNTYKLLAWCFQGYLLPLCKTLCHCIAVHYKGNWIKYSHTFSRKASNLPIKIIPHGHFIFHWPVRHV